MLKKKEEEQGQPPDFCPLVILFLLSDQDRGEHTGLNLVPGSAASDHFPCLPHAPGSSRLAQHPELLLESGHLSVTPTFVPCGSSLGKSLVSEQVSQHARLTVPGQGQAGTEWRGPATGRADSQRRTV